jgi:hypothetical protein
MRFQFVLEETRARSSNALLPSKIFITQSAYDIFMRADALWGETGALLTAGDRLLLEFGVAYALSAFSSTFGRSPASAGVFLSLYFSTLQPSVAKGDECVVWILTTEDGHCVCQRASAIPESR